MHQNRLFERSSNPVWDPLTFFIKLIQSRLKVQFLQKELKNFPIYLLKVSGFLIGFGILSKSCTFHSLEVFQLKLIIKSYETGCDTYLAVPVGGDVPGGS